MRIQSVELRHTKMELVSPFETSLGVELYEEHIIVRVDADGASGWGECVVEPRPSYSSETLDTAWHVLRDFLIPGILGIEIRSVEDALSRNAWVRGHRMARAGLEAALSDAFAKTQGISLSALLGGTRSQIPVGVSVGLQPSTSELVRVVAGYLKDGYKRIKIKIAPGRDIPLLEAVRKEFPNIQLQVDANSAYTLKDVELLRRLDEYDLQLIEQPLEYDDIYDHSVLQSKLKTPICLDESIRSVSDAKAAIALGSCKIINIKPGRVGGYTESKRIHDYCAEVGIPVWHGGMDESGIGRAGNVALATLPNFKLPGDISATKRYYKQDIVEPSFEVDSDGMMAVPTKPGIGVDVLQGRLEKFTVRREAFRA
ncbi:MAG TPA: o-succinylbenzoate synthase [Bacteroidota bacterium]|nr:o-succinylbenzoate synthase [Bacteroidota bacterium]